MESTKCVHCLRKNNAVFQVSPFAALVEETVSLCTNVLTFTFGWIKRCIVSGKHGSYM